MENQFTTKIESGADIEIVGDPRPEHKGAFPGACLINWSLDMELREYGVKDVYCWVKNFGLLYEVEDKDGNEVEHEIEIDMKDWHTSTEVGDEFMFQFIIYSVEIDFDDKKITIKF